MKKYLLEIVIVTFVLSLFIGLIGVTIYRDITKPERKYNFPEGSTNIIHYTKRNFRYDFNCERIFIYDSGFWNGYELTKVEKIEGCE